jgi:S1-C subfamily serine protease
MNDEITLGRGTRHRLRASSIATLLVALVLSATFAWSGGMFSSASSALAQTDTSTPTTTTTDSTVADVAAQATKAVVTITNLQQLQGNLPNGLPQDPNAPGAPGSGNGQLVPVDMGSGYIIDNDGHIVTNNHVIAGGSDFTIEFYDGTTADATLVGTDDLQDVAVLKLKDTTKIPGTISFGNSDTVRVGDDVIAIGTPYGEYTNSVSKGSVAALDRSLDTGEGYRLPNLIQHDASIFPGNSGGPLVNLSGQVIGMNVAKAVDYQTGNQVDGIGFAIDSNAVKAIVDQIIATGKVDRPYLGIQLAQTQDGQAIQQVEPNSPAANGGLQAGDVLKAVDGKTIDEQNPFINQVLFNHKPGDKITVTVDRDGSEQKVDVTLGERPSNFQ